MVTEQQLKASVNTHIFVSGASGTLGRELAIRLARPGVHLSLWGRNEARLSEVADRCREHGARADIRSVDLANLVNALDALNHEDNLSPFDLAFLVAGQGDTLLPGEVIEDPYQVARLGHANFVAPAAMASALAARMTTRGAGRIGLVGTAAASHSLPFAAAYAGSKAGLARYADALRLAVRKHGVSVTLITPGFFAAAQGDHSVTRRPGEISAGIVAERMIAAVASGRAEVVVPRRFLLLRWLDRLLPRPLRDRLLLSLRVP
ncbi:SDR family oxidoreductase [Erythrobacter sp.]|uniref:SDR family NAD(P)-dependent oxidoreductase n=1 Tax=Erythrobacter sp. TaxID=1042 RepID=UPI0025E8446C|nr:SDR family NAD(P)-dependent oxidoreductase [Erythrobacter sp.]